MHSHLPRYHALKQKLLDNDTMIDLRELIAMLSAVFKAIIATLKRPLHHAMFHCPFTAMSRVNTL